MFEQAAIKTSETQIGHNSQRRGNLSQEVLMEKAPPVTTETSDLPSELHTASVSSCLGCLSAAAQTTPSLPQKAWALHLQWQCCNHAGIVPGHRQLCIPTDLDLWVQTGRLHGRTGKESRTDLPSQTILCWHGKKWMSKASSEQTRHSVGTATLETLRLVIVLGVVCTRRRLQVMAEQSEETCCSLQPKTRNQIWAIYSRPFFSDLIKSYWSLANIPCEDKDADAQVAQSCQSSLH